MKNRSIVDAGVHHNAVRQGGPLHRIRQDPLAAIMNRVTFITTLAAR